MSRKFQYQQRPSEAWEKRENQSASSFVGFLADWVNTYATRSGENSIRPLPPTWENPQHYGLDIFVHYSVGPNNASVLCPQKMLNKPCPVCEYQAEVEERGDNEDLAYDLKAKKRVLIWLVDRKNDDKSKDQPVAWAQPWTLDRDVCAISRDRQTGELLNIDHPDLGYDVLFDVKGKGTAKTEYTGIAVARRSTTVDDKYLDFITEHPLPTTLVYKTYDEIKSLMGGDAPTKEDKKTPEPAPKQEESRPQTRVERREVSTPAPAPAAPASDAFCTKPAVKFKGTWFGCSLKENHSGECDYSREMGPVAEVAPATQAAPPPPEPPKQDPPKQAEAAPSDTVNRLRSRFANRS